MRFDVLEIYHGTGHYTIFERGIDLSPNESLRFTAVCTRIITVKLYKTSLQLNFCTFESRDPAHQRFPIDSRGHLTRLSSLSRSMHSSHRCSYAKYSSKVIKKKKRHWSHLFSTSSIFFFSLYHDT